MYKYEYWEKTPLLEDAKFLGKGRIKISVSKIDNKEDKVLCRSFLNIKYHDICKNKENFNRKLMLEYLNIEVDKVFCKSKGINVDDNTKDFLDEKEKLANQLMLSNAIDDFIKQKSIDNPNLSRKTIDWYNRSKDVLLEYFGNVSVDSVTFDDVEKWKEKLSKSNQGVLVNMTLKFAKPLYKYLLMRRKATINVFDVKLIKIELTNDKKMLTHDDMVKLLNQENDNVLLFKNENKNKEMIDEIKSIIKFGLYTGMRISSVLNLKIDEIQNNSININEDKTSNGKRNIPLHNELINFVNERINERNDEDYLFFSKDKDDRSTSQKHINSYFQAILNDKQKRYHSLRKNFITQLDNNYPEHQNYRKYLSGHSIDGVDNKSYIKQRNIAVLIEMVNSVNYAL